MSSTILLSPSRARLVCLAAAAMALACAGLIVTAVLVPPPTAIAPVLALVCIGCPMAAAYELPAAIRRCAHRRAGTALRRVLAELPETPRSLGFRALTRARRLDRTAGAATSIPTASAVNSDAMSLRPRKPSMGSPPTSTRTAQPVRAGREDGERTSYGIWPAGGADCGEPQRGGRHRHGADERTECVPERARPSCPPPR